MLSFLFLLYGIFLDSQDSSVSRKQSFSKFSLGSSYFQGSKF